MSLAISSNVSNVSIGYANNHFAQKSRKNLKFQSIVNSYFDSKKLLEIYELNINKIFQRKNKIRKKNNKLMKKLYHERMRPESLHLCLKTPNLIEHQKPVIAEVKKLFSRINRLQLTTCKNAHITLYMGFDSSPKITKDKEKELYYRLCSELSNIKPFDITVCSKNSQIQIQKKYILLTINDKSLDKLQKKVQAICQKFIEDHNLPAKDGWFDRRYLMHMTIAKSRSQLALNLKETHEKALQSKIHPINIPVDKIFLNGICKNVTEIVLGDSNNRYKNLNLKKSCKELNWDDVQMVKNGVKGNVALTFDTLKAAKNFIRLAEIRKGHVSEINASETSKEFQVKLPVTKYKKLHKRLPIS